MSNLKRLKTTLNEWSKMNYKTAEVRIVEGGPGLIVFHNGTLNMASFQFRLTQVLNCLNVTKAYDDLKLSLVVSSDGTIQIDTGESYAIAG